MNNDYTLHTHLERRIRKKKKATVVYHWKVVGETSSGSKPVAKESLLARDGLVCHVKSLWGVASL